MNGSGVSQRGYVYLGGQTVAVQQQNAVYWMHEDPVAKSKRVTDSSGAVVSIVELDPWGGETSKSSNEAFQPKKFTTYERDVNGSDEAMHRRYNRWWTRFEQPDPYDGSYSLADPQSFNRYSYTQNDPVNYVDPTGMDRECVTITHENGRQETICYETSEAVQIYVWSLPGETGPGNAILRASFQSPLSNGSSAPRPRPGPTTPAGTEDPCVNSPYLNMGFSGGAYFFGGSISLLVSRRGFYLQGEEARRLLKIPEFLDSDFPPLSGPAKAA